MSSSGSERHLQLRSFVRNAWILLTFQLLAAAVAVVVTGWAALRVGPLLEERERLEQDIVQAEARVAELAIAEQETRERVAVLAEQAAALRTELKGARDATPVLTEAIRAFHAKNYPLAIVRYNEALALDPGDPYIHNLKSYSQFKAGDFQGAADTLARALELNPGYDWGYFDLARYRCAAGAPREALRTLMDAVEARGDTIRSLADFFLTKDGEFRRHCADIREELRDLIAQAPD